MSLVIVVIAFISPQDIPGVRRILSFLTKRLTEVYLYQFCLLTIVKELYVRNGLAIDISYIVVVVASLCVLTCIMHYIDGWVGKLVKRG